MAALVGSIDFSSSASPATATDTPQYFLCPFRDCSPYEAVPRVEFRLSGNPPDVTDDSRSHALIVDEQQEYALLGAGSIRNRQALRHRLEGRAHRFTTTSSLETALHLYQDEQLQSFRHLEGKFACAIWDQPNRRLVLACDPFGHKSIYYTQIDQRLVFASRLHALLNEVPRPAIESQAIDAYLTYGFVPRPLSMFEGIHRLRPGRCLVFEKDRIHIDVVHRWSLQPSDESVTATQVVDALTKSVNNHGGPHDQLWQDGRLATRMVAAASDRDLRPVPIVRTSKSSDDLVRYLDEPVASPDPLILLTAFESEKTMGLTTGVGGMEGLLAWPHYQVIEWLARGESVMAPFIKPLAARLQPGPMSSRGYSSQRRTVARWLDAQRTRAGRRHQRLLALWSEDERAELYRDTFLQQLRDDPAQRLSRIPVTPTTNECGAAVTRDLLFVLPDSQLSWIDQVCAEFAVPYDHPWLDEQLLQLSIQYLLDRRWGRASGRLALAAQLRVKNRPPEQHQVSDVEEVVRTRWIDEIASTLRDPCCKCFEYLNDERVGMLLKMQMSRGGLARPLFSLWMLEIMLRQLTD